MTKTDDEQLWFWDGGKWCPLSADGHWHWDGARWNPTPLDSPRIKALGATRPKVSDRLRNLPRWLAWRWVAWFPCLVAWIPALYLAADHHVSTNTLTVFACLFGGASVVATFALGVSLGHHRAWDYLGWSILVGAVFLGLFLWGAAASSQPSNGQDDPGAGLGAMLILAACMIPVTALLYAGGAIGTLVRRTGGGARISQLA